MLLLWLVVFLLLLIHQVFNLHVPSIVWPLLLVSLFFFGFGLGVQVYHVVGRHFVRLVRLGHSFRLQLLPLRHLLPLILLFFLSHRDFAFHLTWYFFLLFYRLYLYLLSLLLFFVFFWVFYFVFFMFSNGFFWLIHGSDWLFEVLAFIFADTFFFVGDWWNFLHFAYWEDSRFYIFDGGEDVVRSDEIFSWGHFSCCFVFWCCWQYIWLRVEFCPLSFGPFIDRIYFRHGDRLFLLDNYWLKLIFFDHFLWFVEVV